jgi:hypothetical protein
MKVFSTKRRSRMLLALAALLILCFAGYLVCRMDKPIVHYTATAGSQCSFHRVAAGDYKIASTAPALAALYTPLRYAELACWKIAKPLGGNC